MQRVWSMTLAHFTARFCGASSMKAPGSRFGESELYHAQNKRKHARLADSRSSDWLGPRASRPQTRGRRAGFQEAARNLFSRFALICGRDAHGPSQTLDQLSAGCFRLTNAQGHKKLALVNLLIACDFHSQALSEVS